MLTKHWRTRWDLRLTKKSSAPSYFNSDSFTQKNEGPWLHWSCWHNNMSPDPLATSLHGFRASQVELVVKNLPANTGDSRVVGSIPRSGYPLEREMVTCSSILAWEIPWTKEHDEGHKNPDTTERLILHAYVASQDWKETFHFQEKLFNSSQC